MITIFKNRLLLFICFILSVGLMASCKKEDAKSTAVELLSFGPTGAKVGDTLRFIGNNLDKVTEIQFTGVNAVVTQKDFKQQTAELILVIVPANTEKGVVTLKTPEGNIVSKSKLNIGVEASITAITPQARPGENITITGDYLNWAQRVTFAKGKVVSTFVSQSKNQLVLTVPEDAQTGTLLVYYGGTDSAEIESVDTLHVTLPVATALSPNPVKHQNNVTITGTDMDLVRQVKFTGVSTPVTTFERQSATEVVVKVPASTTKGKVTLVAASGVSTTSSQDLNLVLPAIANMTPNPVDPEGNLTLTGTNLDLVTGISFTGVTDTVKTFVSQTATQLVVKLPAGVVKGKVVLHVLNSTLKVSSATDLEIVGSTVVPFKVVVYDDAVNSSWQKWGGWGTASQDLANTEHPYAGTNAFKVVYNDNWGAVQFHPVNTFTLPNGYTGIRISIYGGANATASSKVAVYIKNAAGVESTAKQLTLVPGVYTTYEFPLSDLGDPSDIVELNVKNYGTPNLTIYIDEFGLY